MVKLGGDVIYPIESIFMLNMVLGLFTWQFSLRAREVKVFEQLNESEVKTLETALLLT